MGGRETVAAIIRPEGPDLRPGVSAAGRWDAFAHSTLLRFMLVGGLSFVVNQALLVLLYEGSFRSMAAASTPLGPLNVGLLLSSSLALEASILVRFVLNDGWTFRDCHGKPFWQRLMQSNLSSLGSPVICLTSVNVLTPLLGISYLIANSVGISIGLAWNWLWSSRVVWRRVPAV